MAIGPTQWKEDACRDYLRNGENLFLWETALKGRVEEEFKQIKGKANIIIISGIKRVRFIYILAVKVERRGTEKDLRA